MFVRPRTKAIASKMLDLPDPLRPVMALKEGSQSVIWVLSGYDLNPRECFRLTERTEKVRLTFEDQFFDPHSDG